MLKAIATGWGKLGEHGDCAQELQEVVLPVHRDSVCKEVLGEDNFDPKTMMCAGHLEGGRDSLS